MSSDARIRPLHSVDSVQHKAKPREMASHGVARTSPAQTQEQRRQDIDRIRRYRALDDQVRQRVARGHFDPDTLQLTSKLLRLNPEYYSIWNVRRRCLTSGPLSKPSDGSSPLMASPSSLANAIPTPCSAASLPSSSTETQPVPDPQRAGTSGIIPEPTADNHESPENCAKVEIDAIRSELAFTIPLLMEHPKCYWIWKYRMWILDWAARSLDVAIARSIWEEELGLVGKMLHKDRRNFHAWGYRRHVVSQLESPVLKGESMVEPEFEYTTRMIRMDLSNFSAWHNRSQLIPRLLNERGADDTHRKSFLEAELAWVREGLNIDPEDQSLWYYHQYLTFNLAERNDGLAIAPRLSVDERRRYLVGEIDAVKELLEDYEDVKWIYEAVIEYTLAACQLESRQLNPQEQGSVKHSLGKLRELDKKRSGRWHDLETQLGLA